MRVRIRVAAAAAAVLLPLTAATAVAAPTPTPAPAPPKPAPTGPTSIVDVLGKGSPGGYLRDAQGRQVILRGFNTDGRVKVSDDCMPAYTAKDIAREHQDMGTNAVRLLMQWRCVEPQPGTYDNAYLDRVEKLVADYNAHGMTVLLDMHQDVYSVHATPGSDAGNGAPAWAVHMDGKPVPKKKQWWEYYVTPGVIRAFDNFWNKYGNHPELAEHYAKMWGHVASRFAHHRGVVGYDLMNEPYAGSSLPGTVEKGPLSDLYQKCVNEIRKTDKDSWVFLEATAFGTNFGRASELRRLTDPRPGAPKIGYAPHLYPLGSEGGLASASVPGAKGVVSLWQARVRDQARRLSPDNTTVPLILGEFGMDTTKSGSIGYLEHVLTKVGEMGAGALYYASDPGPWGPYEKDGTPRNLQKTMANCFVPVASGNIRYQKTTPTACTLQITTRPGTTQVYLPRGTFSAVTVSGATITGWDPRSRILSIQIPEGHEKLVTVTAGGTYKL
ncbi:hypothetical protein KEM60_02180 [Austwickia sp. TVS 96-490-7B]|uniref:glycoside hydrolase family 5 protein n=1 Tax=Austwickia sp. TVS 96-490-7B TaxID=2830843 RepID=UPI001C5A3E60|nr:cellulase family glycosylhydrolase [Austwickia sp. TVS 96-490-7B]MBW3085969.1 hypothetical protein [Austwickia sp. TVS 96-490-7B]